MATHWIDFDSYSAGAGVPTGFTQTANNGTATVSVVAVGGGIGNVLQMSNTTSSPSTLTYDAANGDTGRGTCEIAVKLRMTTLGASAGFNCGPLGRAQTGSNTGYQGYIRQQGASNLGIRRAISTTIASATNATIGTPAINTFYWLLLQCSGTALRLKAWPDGGSPPGTWEIDSTDSTYSDGPLGVVINNLSGVYQFKYIGLGTNGDAAPLAAPGGGTAHHGAVSLGGSLSLTSAAKRGVHGAVALAGSLALTPAPHKGMHGAVTLTGSLALSATPTLPLGMDPSRPLAPYLKLTYFAVTVTQSTPDPLAALLAQPYLGREVVIRGYPTDANGSVVNVDLSAGGYHSQPTDNPYQLFPGAIRRPYNFTVSLPLPSMAGSTQLGIGDQVLNNGNGALDSAALLDWLGKPSDVYLGPEEPAPWTQFTNIFKGITAGVVWDLDSLSLLHRDMRFKLKTELQKNRYKGLGAAVRYNGSASYASGTVNSPAGNMSIACYMRRQTSITTIRNVVTWYDGVNIAGLRSFQVGATANTPRFSAGNDAGALFTVNGPTTLPLDVLVPVIASIDLSSMVLRFSMFLNGVWLSSTPVVITGTFNTVETLLEVGRLQGGTNYFQGDVDEIAIFSSVMTSAQQASFAARPLTGGETGLLYLWHCDEGSGTTLGPGIVGGPSLTLTSASWVGSLEGNSSLTSVVKPVALGKRRQVQPKLVDSQRLVYQFHDGTMEGIDALRDSGDLLTFGSDLTDIYSVVPAAGTWNSCKAMGLVRLGSSPTGTITGDIRGANGGQIGYAETAAGIDRKLTVDYGGLSNTLGIDDGAYDRLNLANSAVIGEYFDTEIKIDEAKDRVLKNVNAWGGPTRLGIETVGRIDDPASLPASITWTQDDLDYSSGTPYRRVPLGIRYKEIVIGYRPYHTTLSADQVAGVVGLSSRDDFEKPHRYASKTIPGASPDANILTILTSLDSETDALAEIDRLVPFLGRDLDNVTVSLKQGVLTHFVGTIVSLSIQQTRPSGVVFYRYNAAMKNYVVVGIGEDLGESGTPDRLQATLVG